MTAEIALLREMFDAAIASADPEFVLPPYLPPPPPGRTLVIAAGKAAFKMAAVVEAHWPAGKPLSGIAVTRHGSGACNLPRIQVIEASHPVPDQASQDAAVAILAETKMLGPDDLALCLISGGGSSLMALPLAGISLAEKRQINRELLKSGASISEMNCVRKHLSAIKGGRLTQAIAPARLVTLVISDVPGDDLTVIASGPTVPDPTTQAQAREVLARYGITPPASVLAALQDPHHETPKPGDGAFAHVETRIIATPQAALEAAARVARQAGFHPLILGDALEGEAREVGKLMAGIARQVIRHDQPVPAPCVLISGGETTVTVRGSGRGGRNVEFLLALAIGLDGLPGTFAIAGDTDGVDGAADIAGAVIDPSTLRRALTRGVNPRESLGNNDGHGFFEALGDQIVTGATQTNVNDFRAILVKPQGL